MFLAFGALSAFGQTEKARLIDEIGVIPCGEYMARLDGLFQAYSNSPGSKIYVIYYEGVTENVRDKKSEKMIIVPKIPIRGSALNKAKAVPLYLKKTRKLSKDQIILIDGGFKEEFQLALWLVPVGANAPEPTPTVDAETVKLKSGNPARTPDIASCYSGYE